MIPRSFPEREGSRPGLHEGEGPLGSHYIPDPLLLPLLFCSEPPQSSWTSEAEEGASRRGPSCRQCLDMDLVSRMACGPLPQGLEVPESLSVGLVQGTACLSLEKRQQLP